MRESSGKVECPDCNGTGSITLAGVDVECGECWGGGEVECPDCNGTGLEPDMESPCPSCQEGDQ